MAQKFLILDAGRTKQLEASTTSAGAGDAGKVPGLDGSGRLDQSMMPVGVGPDTATITASENLAAGDLVNVWDDSGTTKIRKADATAEGKEADGFVLASVTSGQSGLVYFDGTISGLSGLTRGARYFLSADTPGAITTTPPSSTGNVVQRVGKAKSATELVFEAFEPITLA